MALDTTEPRTHVQHAMAKMRKLRGWQRPRGERRRCVVFPPMQPINMCRTSTDGLQILQSGRHHALSCLSWLYVGSKGKAALNTFCGAGSFGRCGWSALAFSSALALVSARPIALSLRKWPITLRFVSMSICKSAFAFAVVAGL